MMEKLNMIKEGGKIAWEWTKEHKKEAITYGLEGIQFIKNLFKKKEASNNAEETGEDSNIEVAEEPVVNNASVNVDNTSEKIQELEKIVTYLVGERKIIVEKIDEVISENNNQFSKLLTEVEQLKKQITDAEKNSKTLSEENSQLKEMINKLEKNIINRNVLYTFIGVALLAVVLSIVSIML